MHYEVRCYAATLWPLILANLVYAGINYLPAFGQVARQISQAAPAQWTAAPIVPVSLGSARKAFEL